MFFCEQSLRKINEKDVELLRNGSVHESVDYFETRKYFRRRKKEDLLSFGDDWNDAPRSSRFCSFALESRPLIFDTVSWTAP